VDKIDDRRDTLGLTRYPCRSRLNVTSRTIGTEQSIKIHLVHRTKHPRYVSNECPEEVLDFIDEHRYLTPSDITKAVREKYPKLAFTNKQVITAWNTANSALWKREGGQIESSRTLIGEFSVADHLELADVPEGVQALAFGIRPIGEMLKDKVVEIAMDATCKLHLFLERLFHF
jgi:hypothetical protein